MFTTMSWLLLAYEIGLIFDCLDSYIDQFTFLWLMRNINDLWGNTEQFKKGLIKVCKLKEKDLAKTIKMVDEISRKIVNQDLITQGLTAQSMSIKDDLKTIVEDGLKDRIEKAMQQKEMLVEQIRKNNELVLENKEQALKQEIINTQLHPNSYNIDLQKRMDVERHIRDFINQKAVNDAIYLANKDGLSIFWACSHLQDSAEDHAPVQDRLFISKHYKANSYYVKHQAECDKIIKEQKPLILEDAIDGTMKYNYKLKDGTPRTRGVFLCTRPNCRHRVIQVTREQATNLLKWRKSQVDQFDTGKYEPQKYKALQKQRKMERALRLLKTHRVNLKNALNYASNPTPIKLSIKELNKQIKAIENGIEVLCNQYGIPRQKTREQIEKLSFNLGL